MFFLIETAFYSVLAIDKQMSSVTHLGVFGDSRKRRRDPLTKGPSTSWVLRAKCRGAENRLPNRNKSVDILGAMDFERFSDEILIENYRSVADPKLSRQYVEELFRRNHLKIARWCYRFSRDRDLAADLAQEVCAKAYSKLESFQNQSRFSTWLFSIARNHCLNVLRARSTDLQHEADEEILTLLPDRSSTDPESELARRYDGKLVREFLSEALDETERVVFTLHFAEDLSLDQITSILGLTNASGAKAYIVSAKRKLERAVERWKSRSGRPNR